MTTESAKKLQVRIAKEALAMLASHGNEADTTSYEQSIRLIGKTRGLPHECCRYCLGLIEQEREAILDAGNYHAAKHVIPEKDLPMRATGTEALDNIWDLFETAVQHNDIGSHAMLLNMAHELEETQNLLDWIKQSPEERAEWDVPEKAV